MLVKMRNFLIFKIGYNPFHSPILVNLENPLYVPLFEIIFPFRRELIFKMIDYLGTPHLGAS